MVKVWNSLTRKNSVLNVNSKKVLKWYNCGPTVYNSSHLGHARNYISIDVMRRILEDYFHQPIVFVQNITDVDDKILNEATARGISSRDLATFYEDEFFQDMDDLNVKRPTFVTRVSEYIPEIQDYVSSLMDKGFAYERDGSIYFDTVSFEKEGYTYGKMKPCGLESGNFSTELSNEILGSKKNPRDFALWKKDEVNGYEWGNRMKGRPGWHIECSTMAQDVLGSQLDIHSGGIDLCFPHHTNEIAQAEAFNGQNEWVNVFLHVGHLHIHGKKMSKSLKNFTTIRDTLNSYNYRAIRMMALQHKYSDPMEFSENVMDSAVELDLFFKEYFLNVSSSLSQNEKIAHEKPTREYIELYDSFMETKNNVDALLRDGFNTPKVLIELKALVHKFYSSCYHERKIHPCSSVSKEIMLYIFKILHIFGVYKDPYIESYYNTSNGEDKLIRCVLNAVSEFRDEIRNHAKDKKDYNMLNLCDYMRDHLFPKIGVRIEDCKVEGKTKWKIDNDAAEKNTKPAPKQLNLEKKVKKSMIPPEEYFQSEYFSEKFVAFDELGIPTHGEDGQPLGKKKRKKLEKEYSKQKERYDKEKNI